MSPIPWLGIADAFPDPSSTSDPDPDVPGLFAVSEHIYPGQLSKAYQLGLFPWYSDRQPVLWWSPDPRMALHEAGHAHSIAVTKNGQLVGGLYCVNFGGMVYGESMFSHTDNASKIALAALCAWCYDRGVEIIDCQQETPHLHSLGARPIARTVFLQHIRKAIQQNQSAGPWSFDKTILQRWL